MAQVNTSCRAPTSTHTHLDFPPPPACHPARRQALEREVAAVEDAIQVRLWQRFFGGVAYSHLHDRSDIYGVLSQKSQQSLW